MKLLVLCTGNTCRSQMAEAFFKHYYPDWEVYSAGTHAEEKINPLAVKVMKEKGMDLSGAVPTPVEAFLDEAFDVVLTVCSDAEKECPVFYGKVKKRLHRPFDDPAACRDDEETCLPVYRKIRDEIEKFVKNFGVGI